MIQVEWDADEQEYFATTPDWPYLTGFGDTEEEAKRELEQVIEVVLDIIKGEFNEEFRKDD